MKRRRDADICRVTANGTIRRCLVCHEWKPQDALHYYRKGSAASPHRAPTWFGACKGCYNAGRLKRASVPADKVPSVMDWMTLVRMGYKK